MEILVFFVIGFFVLLVDHLVEARGLKKQDILLRKRFEEIKDEVYSVTAVIYLRDNSTVTCTKEFTSYLGFSGNVAIRLYKASNLRDDFVYDLERDAKYNGLKFDDNTFYTPANIMKIEYK